MSAAALAAINADNRLSFHVKDDTRVLSAKLQINRCCVNSPRREASGMPFASPDRAMRRLSTRAICAARSR